MVGTVEPRGDLWCHSPDETRVARARVLLTDRLCGGHAAHSQTENESRHGDPPAAPQLDENHEGRREDPGDDHPPPADDVFEEVPEDSRRRNDTDDSQPTE